VLADSYFPGWKAYSVRKGADADADKPLAIHLGSNVNYFASYNCRPSPGRCASNTRPTRSSGRHHLTDRRRGRWSLGWAGSPGAIFTRRAPWTQLARRVAKNSLAPLALTCSQTRHRFCPLPLSCCARWGRTIRIVLLYGLYYAIFIFGWSDIITNYTG